MENVSWNVDKEIKKYIIISMLIQKININFEKIIQKLEKLII